MVRSRTRLHDLPASFWWLWLTMLVISVGGFVIPFLTIFLTTTAEMSSTAAGAAISAFGAGTVLASLVGGVLADRLGSKHTLVAGLVGSVVVLSVIPQFVESPWTLAATLALYGMCHGAIRPTIATAIADVVASQHRHAAYSYATWASNLGWAIGPTIAGLLSQVDYALLFYGEAAVTAIAAVVVAATVQESARIHRRRLRDAPVGADSAEAPLAAAGQFDGMQRLGLGAVLTDKVFLVLFAAMFLFSCVYIQFITALPVVMMSQGLNAQDYGLLLMGNGLMICLLQVPILRIFAGKSPATVMAISLGLTCAGTIAQAFASQLWIYVLAVAFWTLGEVGYYPAAQTTSVNLSIARIRGRYQGTYALASAAAFMIAPVAGGALLDQFGSRALWLACAATCLMIAALLLASKPRQDRRIVEVAHMNDATVP